jgi:serine/threonine protein kinase
MSDVLGSGSYSVVYRGRRLLGGGAVAIKVVNKGLIKDEVAYENMKKEIKVMGELDHPNIVRFLAVFQTVNNIYIIMEYCNQGTLLALMRRAGPLPEAQVWAILTQLTRALRYLVQKSVLHRDLKPENILLADGVPKLIDFGFACQLGEGPETRLQDNMGSPLYMSPQLLVGESYTAKSDVWSLGIILYEMLYGHTPWPSKDKAELIFKTLNHPLHIQRGPSPAFIELVVGCLRIREADRLSFPELFLLVDRQKLVPEQAVAPSGLVSVKSSINFPKKQLL